MKKLLTVIAIMLSLASCKKQTSDQLVPQTREEIATARPNSNQFYHTCANSYPDQTAGSEGLAASANVEKLSLQGGNIKSWWMGAYYNITLADGTIEQDWVQWGYAVDQGGLFPAFYVYSIYPIYRYKAVVIFNQDQNVPLKYNTRVRFEIKRVEGTTLWSFLRDGQKCFDVDLGTTNFDGALQSCTESWGSSSFSNIVHIDYFDTYKNGAWSHVPSAYISSLSWRLVPGANESEHEFGGKLSSNSIPGILW